MFGAAIAVAWLTLASAAEAQAPVRQQEAAAGDPARGATAYRTCLSCHSLEPGRHMTGPSLGGVLGRPAGKAAGYDRYSPALAAATFDWTPEKLDLWLESPSKMLPGNRMTALVGDAQTRADLIAYFEKLKSGDTAGLAIPRESRIDLKTLGRASRVTAVRHCGESFFVTLENGSELAFWERNLRLRVDSSTDGPNPGHPTMLPGGMEGDRSSLIFSAPGEISSFITSSC